MEKQTRINKYKELRDEMKEEVAIDRQMTYEHPSLAVSTMFLL